jgi:peptidoglycan/xylan/chitin deacetylase (PgdA/CDA1 family)
MTLREMPFSSRGVRNLLSRVRAIFSRFGMTPGKIDAKLNRYVDITEKFDCVPTFPLTAVSLSRHPKLIRKLSDRGVEFAVHGYIHTDYRSLPVETQTRHFEKAIDVFESCQICYTGFRAPYLRGNGATIEALGKLNFVYDSTETIWWDVVDKSKYNGVAWDSYRRLLAFYKPRSAEGYLSLPRFRSGIVEIPVSIPDDEVMIDRLGITDAEEIARIWETIFRRTHARGELFTIQLHHERILICERALEAILQQARGLGSHVWIATLGELAEWWKEKEGFAFEIDSQGNGEYRAKANCSERATILLRNCKVNRPTTQWFDGYQSISARDFVIQSSTRPFVGVAPSSSPHAIRFLEGEGLIVEKSDKPHNYGIYLHDLANFQESDEKRISEAIEASDAPLLRYGRWPAGAKSALAVTGDIDSITLFDFAMRVLEVWRQNGRHG